MRRTSNNLIRKTAGEIVARAITGHTTQQMTEPKRPHADVLLFNAMLAHGFLQDDVAARELRERLQRDYPTSELLRASDAGPLGTN